MCTELCGSRSDVCGSRGLCADVCGSRRLCSDLCRSGCLCSDLCRSRRVCSFVCSSFDLLQHGLPHGLLQEVVQAAEALPAEVEFRQEESLLQQLRSDLCRSGCVCSDLCGSRGLCSDLCRSGCLLPLVRSLECDRPDVQS